MAKRFPQCFLSGSFRSEDEDVFRWFRKLLEAMDFNVVDAHKPEPRPPEDKVRSLIQASDVVVALLTHQEKIENQQLWTAPEWVLNEIGMAFAENKPVALFLEEGTRIGGLIDRIADYVTFDRRKLGDASPLVVRYLYSIRSTLAGVPATGVEITVARALLNELGDRAHRLQDVEDTLEPFPPLDLSHLLAKVSGRLFALPDGAQRAVGEAYRALHDLNQTLQEVWGPLGKKRKPPEGEISQKKERAGEALGKALVELLPIAYPGALEQIGEVIRLQSESKESETEDDVKE